MKHRFESKKKNSYSRNLFVSLSVFALVFAAFCLGLNSVSSRTEEEELKTLETAVTRGVTHCYAVEGAYPESLEYLKTNYGLLYDEEKFLVVYQPMGANMMPDVTIIRRKE